MSKSFYEGATAGDTNFRRSWKTTHQTLTPHQDQKSTGAAKKWAEQDEDMLVQSHHDRELNLEANLNKTTVVETITPGQQPGYYCAVCEYTAKDSSTYLDHINSKFHQRNLGVSLRVERSTIEQVRARIEFWKRKRQEPDEDFTMRVDRLQKQDEELKRQRKEEKKAKRLALAQEQERDRLEKESQRSAEEEDMAALMGFSSFDSSKSKPKKN